MTDVRRTLLWVVFSMSLFLIWNSWNQHNGKPSMFSPAPAKPVAPVTSPATADASRAPVATATSPVAPAAPPPAARELATVSTELVKATFSNEGGSLVRLELLKYKDQVEFGVWDSLLALVGLRSHPSASATNNVMLFDESADRYYVARSGLTSEVTGVELPNSRTLMSLVPGDRQLRDGQDTLQLRYESPPVAGVKLVKTYTFHRDDYVIDVRNEVVNASGAPVSPRLYLQLVRDGNPPPGGSGMYSTYTGVAIDDGNKFEKVAFKDIEKRAAGERADHTASSDSGWIAMVQHYFTTAWLIDRADGSKQRREYFTGKSDEINPATGREAHLYTVSEVVPLGTIAPGASASFDSKLFAGPQEENRLAALAPRLELVKDYGIFKILAEPLFWLLTQIHKLFGNWGWSIVGLVVLLRIAFFWLNFKAYSSMARMKAISPKITEMRERMKDKPQQMQQEMMRIYREEKINPLGGCLPIFIQMPFFISLYWVLLSTVEMRGAPWIGWVHDLSVKDPYFILPLLMTCSSLLQTWLNPTPADPMQAKMMWFMPLIFSVMFFVFPAGLVLYWLTNNILGIAQQYLINKKLGVLGK